MGIPIQLSDSFESIMKLSTSWSDILYGEFTQHAYLRPMRFAELKLVYDASGGDYFSWFRGTQIAQVVVLLVRLLDRQGAIVEDGQRRAFACLAVDLDVGDVAEYLTVDGAAPCEPGQALARVTARTNTAGGGR